MAQFRIVAVSMSGGTSHEHILLVRLNDGRTLGVSEVISGIRAGDFYYTYADNKAAAVEPFPQESGPHIRTRADGRLTNNLLMLPRF